MNTSKTHNKIIDVLNQLKLKNERLSSSELLEILEHVNQLCLDKTTVKLIIDSVKSLLNIDISKAKLITDREAEVIHLISRGLQSADIAKSLKLSKSTIETHRKNIRKKLNLKGKDSLFAFALVFSLQSESHQIIRG